VARSTLYEDFLAFVRRNALFSPGERVLAAVSGGPDSVALFDLLKRFSARGRIRLFACHLDHRLRGAASAADAAFVAALARKLRVPLVSARRDVAKLAARKRLTIEAAAREARYEFFLRAARKLELTRVATAHTLSDNAETILQRLIEGAGPAGLAGIPVSRPLDAKGRFLVVRPLLFATRAEIEKYVARRGLKFRLDRSNLEPVYTRNRIRLEFLPVLKKLAPSAEETISRAGANVSALLDCVRGLIADAEAKIIEREGRASIVLRRAALLAAPRFVAGEVLKNVIARAGVEGREILSAHFEAVLALARGRRPSASVALPSGLVARREYERIVVGKGRRGRRRPTRVTTHLPTASGSSTSIKPTHPDARPAALEIPGVTSIAGGARIEAKMLKSFDLRAFLKHKTAEEEVVDADALLGGVVLRPPLRGERLVTLGARGRRKLQDFFTDLKVPARLRKAIPVVADDLGIIWVAGLRIADRVKVVPATRKFLYLRFLARER